MQEVTVNINELEIHELAKLTPTMTKVQYEALKASILEHGQQVPVVVYRGKIIDGRHRCKAIRELGMTDIKTVSEDSRLSLQDVRTKILDVYENRRHQTPTQKAIMAYRVYSQSKADGEKVGQGSVAESCGTTVKQLGRAKQLHTLAGDEVLELLFQGSKLNTGTVSQPNNTDSLSTLILYFKNRTKSIIDNTNETTINEDFTDEEIELCNSTLRELTSVHSVRMLKRLNGMLHYHILDIETDQHSLHTY